MKNRQLLLALLFSCLVLAQNAYADNKVITRKFKWQIQSIPNFYVYYYGPAGLSLLPYAEDYLQKAFQRVTKTLPRPPKERSPFFLYNNHNEYEESNITPIGEGTGGVTEAAKNRFLIGHTGPQRELEYVIAHEYSHEVEYEYLFSGFWRSIRLLKFIFYPNWLMEGLAEYSAGDLDSTTREMYMRDAATSGKLLPLDQLHSFNHVFPHQVTLAYKESEALMRYIAEEYGEDKLPAMVASFRDRYDSNSVLFEVIGTDLNTLDRKFREYMEDKYAAVSKGLSEPETYGGVMTKKGAYPRFFESAVFSPDGKNIAYISDEPGYKAVYIADISGKKPVCVSNLEKTIKAENVNSEGNGLSFSGDGQRLYFCGERLQKDLIFCYDLQKKRLTAIDPKTETAASPAVSRDGKTVYFSGMRDGFRNIFSIDLDTLNIKMLTAGAFDKIDAALSPDGAILAFSQERPNAAGRTEYDISVLYLNSGKQEFVTSLSGDERWPCFSSDGGKVYFTSDRDGINDIYEMSVTGGDIKRLTNVIGGNFQPKVSPDGSALMFSSFRHGEKRLYTAELGKLRSLARPESVPGAFEIPAGTAAARGPGLLKAFGENRGEYRFRASTDFFFPVIFYSSLDGFYSAFLWQASDLLGDHQLQTIASYASGFEYLNYQLTYAFLRYRPQFYVNFTGNEYFVDAEETDKKIENSQTAGVEYPLDRFEKLQLQLTTIDRKEVWKTDLFSASARSRENVAGLAFIRDTARGPYLEATSGGRFSLQSEFSEETFAGNYIYQNYLAEINRFFPLGKEHTLGLRMLAGASYGRDAGYFRLGGVDRVRAIPESQPYYGKRVFVANVEWRIPLVHNINYHMWYMFPDFFFKTLYMNIFADGGFLFNDNNELIDITIDRWKGSYGISFKFHTFIIETFDLPLNFQFAQRMDDPGWVFYFSAGAAF